jgi:hypothetical protein
MKLIKDKAGNIDTTLTKAKKDGVITNKEYEGILTTMKENMASPSFKEMVYAQSLDVLSSAIALVIDKSGRNLELAYSSGEAQNVLEKKIGDLINSLEIAPGIAFVEGKATLVFGFKFKLAQKLDETSGFTAEMGTNIVS